MARACGRGGHGAVRTAAADHGHPRVMHGAKATTAIACGSDREVLDGLIRAIPAHDFLLGWFTGIADAMGCECPLLVYVWRLIVFVRSGSMPKATADAPVPPTEASPEALATAQATLDAQLVTIYMSLPACTTAGNLHRLLGSAPDGVAQRAQGRVRVGDQEREAGGGDRSIGAVDCERWESVGGGGRDGQAWVVVFGDQVDLIYV
jgi:hypothetical protein